MIRLLCASALALTLSGPASAQDLNALARVLVDQTTLEETRQGVQLDLALSQGVPFRGFTLNDPMRVVLDFREVNWAGIDPTLFGSTESVGEIRVGRFRDGWSRMVIELTQPNEISTLSMSGTGQGAETVLTLELAETDAETFAISAGAPDGAGWDLPDVVDVPIAVQRQTGDRDVVVVLDAGHGGIDPGAVVGDLVESDLMLMFVRELREALVRAGGFEVVLTRETDVFVPLKTRVSIARSVRADLFMSFHADSLETGTAHGAAIFTLSDDASDRATELLAERHDRADLLAGVDLADQGDEIARVLMDLARIETQPRADALGDTVAISLKAGGVRLFKRPRQAAGFSVLKAPDIPSILVELGYLSSNSDRENLLSRTWRATTIDAIVSGIQTWAVQDAAQARLLRR